MSEDETKIMTTAQVRVKDPKRVTAGKRLGAISKAAKEKKAKERYDRERELDIKREWNLTCPIVGVAIVGLIGLCYVCCKRGEPVQMEGRLESCPKPCPKPKFDIL